MPPGKPPFIKTPTPLRPNPWRDGEDPIPDLKPKPPPDGDSKEVTLGWADEPAAPGDYAEIIRRAASAPRTVVHTMTVEARGDWSSLRAALEGQHQDEPQDASFLVADRGDWMSTVSTAIDGEPVLDELDDAGISLDYDPVEICATTFAQIIGEELYEDDDVDIDKDEDLPSVTIGSYTFTISTTIRGGALRLAEALHALGEALRHNAAEATPCPDCVSEPCHACIAEEE